MSSGVMTGMRLEVQPRDGAGAPATAVVFDAGREITIRFRRDLPSWCVTGTEIVLTVANDPDRPVMWTSEVISTADDEQLATISAVEGEEAVERRRAARPLAPVPLEWSQPPDRRRHPGVGIDLNRLGVRFRTPAGLEVRHDRIVLAVFIPSGAITAQGTVVGSRGTEVRVEFVALHPEALRRLVAWEAELIVDELAAPTEQIGAGGP